MDTKPRYYTRAQYYRDCEERRVLAANEQRKAEEIARILNGRRWP